MTAFPVDRAHPPRRIVFRDPQRHLVLRPFAVDDVDASVAAIQASLPELRAFLSWAHLPVTQETQLATISRFQGEYWTAGRDMFFAAIDGNDGAMIGGLGLHARVPLNPSGLEVGYWCHSRHAGRGIVTLAVQMAIVFAFDWLDTDRFQVMHDETNDASRRVIEKCGFVFEGTLRNAVAEASDELKAAGYRGTARQRLYSLVPSDLPGLSWPDAIRRGLVVHDALDRPHAG
jgi:RimJ/RimL family protein N-acetyltransferase